MDENRKNKNYFVSTLAKYYQEFLSTDFKKVRAPKRKFSTKDAKNRKIGLLIDKYPSLYEKFYERANKAGIEKAQFTINKNSYSTKLSELNKKMLVQEIGAIDTIYFLGKVEETVDELVEKIERVNYKLDTEKEYQIFINSIEIALRGNIIAPLIESISNHIENIQTRALDSLINIEQELADITMENFSGSVSEIFIDFLISKNREQLVENIRDYYESFNYQYFYFDYFENLQTGDAFNELREIKLNEDLIENVEFYLNFGSLNYKNYKFPLCYMPININLVEEKISISFNPQLFVNKKAIDFVLEEISRKYNKPYKSLFQERVMFLDETSVITDFLNDVIYKIQNNIEISEPVNYDKFNINFAKTSDVMISTSITLSLFDKSDESMINDYEALLTGLESEDKLFELFESLVNKFIDTEPDNYINEIEDKWDETDLDTRLVYNSPLPLAEEQRKILIALKNPQIQFLFVEGPPGTGKSHTISAIAFDAILEKKSILILSDKKEALDVVENKLNEALNKARDGEEYPNPLLRLGKKENNFNKLMTGANQQKINNYIRIRKKNSSKINKEEKEIYTHLTDDISGYIKKTKTIDMNELKTFLEMEDQIEDSLLDKIEEKPSVYLESFSRLASHITELRSNELFLKKIAENIEINFENISNFNKILKKIKSDNLQLGLVDSLPKVNINELKVLDETINSMELMSRSLMGFAFKKNLLENLENKLNNTYSGSISLKGKKRSLIELKSFKDSYQEIHKFLDKNKLKKIKVHFNKLIPIFNEITPLSSRLYTFINDYKKNEDIKILYFLLGENFELHKLLFDENSDDFYNFSLVLSYLSQYEDFNIKFSQDNIDYFGEKTKIEQINASKLAFDIDKKAISFAQNNKAQTKVIKQIIRKKQKFPTGQFNTLKQGFPCIISSLRDYAEFIPLNSDMFDLIVIDEASQVSIAQAMPAILRAKKVIVMGDRNQYSNVKTTNASKELNNTFMSDLMNSYSESKGVPDSAMVERIKMFDVKSSVLDFFEMFSNFDILLKKHFRGYPEMISFSSKYFYENALQSMKIRTQPIEEVLEFHKVELTIQPEFKNSNIEEINYIINLIEQQLETEDFRSVAIITPHNEQQSLFGKILSQHPKYDEMKRKLKLKVFTFDGCQGEERDIIYYSFVANTFEDKLGYIFPKDLGDMNGDIDFNLRKQRLNVGFSRGKEKLVFVHSKPIEILNSSIKIALLHYKNILENTSSFVDENLLDKNSPMEKKVLEALYMTTLYKESQQNRDISFEIFPQLQIGEYLRSIDSSYVHPKYKTDFFITIKINDLTTQLIVEYDGFEHHFKDWNEVTEYNWESYLTDQDIERQFILESYGYKMIRLNKFNFSKEPWKKLDEEIMKIVESNLRVESSSIQDLKNKQAYVTKGLEDKSGKFCPKCSIFKDLEEFADDQLGSGYGRICLKCKNVKRKKCPKCKKMKYISSFDKNQNICWDCKI